MQKHRASISSLIMKFFRKHPKKNIPHGPVVDWVETKYFKLYKKKPRDTWRQIRRLHQEGKLLKIKKGIYKYDPDVVQEVELFDFPSEIKVQIFKRDGYKCVVCGRGPKDGVEICADHLVPKDKGGTNVLDNGQTLCMEHNLMKKNYSQTEAGKKYFIKMYKKALARSDKRMIEFCKGVFNIYNKYRINSHIPRPDKK